jgi:hypothetical protein
MQRLAFVSLLFLAACQNKRPDDEAVLAEANKLTKPLPGLYRSTTSLVSFDLPGADPRTADMIRDRFAQVLPQHREFCLTPRAAARGFEDMVRQSQQGDCRIESFVADNSHLSAQMSCRLAAKLNSTVSVDGTGGPDSSHIDLRIVQTGPSVPGGTQTMAMKVDNVRVGDCPQ